MPRPAPSVDEPRPFRAYGHDYLDQSGSCYFTSCGHDTADNHWTSVRPAGRDQRRCRKLADGIDPDARCHCQYCDPADERRPIPDGWRESVRK